MPGLLHQELRHPAGSRTDFQHNVSFGQIRAANDILNQVDVDQEILAKIPARVVAMPLEQRHQMRSSLALGIFHRAGKRGCTIRAYSGLRGPQVSAEAYGFMNRRTYLPRMSVSIFTRSPT